jgi:hypothetical protein
MQMKKTVLLLAIVFAGFCISSCRDMDTDYREYIVPNGIVYPQKADSLKIYSGVGKVKLEWLVPVDPKVVRAMIYWDNYTDSAAYILPTDRAGLTYIGRTIEGLKENTYTFYVKTYDEEDHVSIPADVTGPFYGDTYQAGLRIQNILPDSYLGNSGWCLFLDEVSEDALYTEIEYKVKNGTTQTIAIPVPATDTVIPDVAPETPFRCRTFYTAANYTEPVPSLYREGTVPAIFRNEIRPVTVVTKFGNGYAIALGKVEKNTYSDIFYKNGQGEDVSARVPANDPAVYLYDYNGSGFSQIAYFVSESPAETFRTERIAYTGAVNDRSVTVTSSAPAILKPGDFDLGGEGVGFHDSNTNHDPGSGGANYRPNLGDYLSNAMDIDGDGGTIGYSNTGEWVLYTVEVRDEGNYEIDWYISVNNAAGGSCHVEVDGVKSEICQMVNNSSWNAWRYYCETNSVAPPVFHLTAGKHTVKFVWNSNTFTYNGMRMTYKP